MKIIADEQIPWLDDFFAARGHLIKIPSESISQSQIQNADLLLVRSVNTIDLKLLENSRVKMVGSTTAGFDHVDTTELHKSGIHFNYAPGCNANAVAEYVLACIAKLIQMNRIQLGQRAGIIGLGHVGTHVAEKLSVLDFSVLLNDPPRAQTEPNFRSASLSEFDELDLICVHTSLTHSGPFPSYHLLNSSILHRLKPKATLINAGRGEVLDEEAFLERKDLYLCSDVWAKEPHINSDLVNRALVATPHIAGYSIQAKFRATAQIYEAAQEFFSWPKSDFSPTWERQTLSGSNWKEVLLQVIPLDALRIENGKFSENRKRYALRNEFAFCDVHKKNLPQGDQEILQKLGFNLK